MGIVIFGEKSKTKRIRIGNTVIGFSDKQPKHKPLTAAEAKKHEIERAKEQIKKAKELGIKDYIIRTSEDCRVCEKCEKYSKIKQPFKKVKIGINFPPLHDDCRCYAEPIIDS